MGLKERITGHRHYGKVVQWGKLAAVTASAQVAVQVLAFLSGILVIRLLPVREYAFYTIANTMLGMLMVLSDGGISTGVMAAGGKVWQDRRQLGTVLAMGMDLRRKFALGALVVVVPLLIRLLVHNHASPLTIALIVLSLIPAVWAGLSDSILQIAPKLHRDVWPLQRNQLGVATGRLGLTALSIFFFPLAWVAVAAAGLPRIVGNLRLRKINRGYVDVDAPPDPEVRRYITGIVKRVMPTAAYYAISSQLAVWILSVAGNTQSVAQVGALGRVAILTTVLGTLFSTLAYPSFARSDRARRALFKRLQIVTLAVVVLSLAVVGLTWLFSGPILWVLGPAYAGLDTPLVLAMGSACVGLVSGTIGGMMSSRGWPVNPVLLIVLNLALIVSGILIFDVTQLGGVLKFNIYVASSYLWADLVNVWRRFRTLKKQEMQ